MFWSRSLIGRGALLRFDWPIAPSGRHHFENLTKTIVKSDAKSDLKHVRSLINTRLDALESELGEIKSTRATKSITNRLTEQTGLLRTKIDELKNKLDRELDEASDELKDEIKGYFLPSSRWYNYFCSEIEETMKTDLSMVKDMLANVQNSQERVSSNQGMGSWTIFWHSRPKSAIMSCPWILGLRRTSTDTSCFTN